VIIRAIVAACVAALPACASTAPDTVLLNGKVFTANPARPWAQALAIRGDRVVAVGDTPAVAGLAGSSTRRIDLGGRTVVPGFNDAHVHVSPRPAAHIVPAGDEPSAEQVEQALAGADRTAAPGVPLQVEIGARVLDDSSVTRAWLDACVPDRPVMLRSFTGHGAQQRGARPPVNRRVDLGSRRRPIPARRLGTAERPHRGVRGDGCVAAPLGAGA
jgi:hypothetical protein